MGTVTESADRYPEPRLRRKIWQSLDGEWEFRFGDDESGKYPLKIKVPYAYQCKASGIGDRAQHDVLWYKRTFVLTEEMQKCRTVYLNFLAVDYECAVYVNGKFALFHEGGYDEFGADIRPYLSDGVEQTIEIRVYDPMNKTYPRGKQNWQETPQRCWYYATSGIWQSVWLYGCAADYISGVRFETSVERTQACAYVETGKDIADEVTAVVQTPYGGEEIFSSTAKSNGVFALSMAFAKPDCICDMHLWSAAAPNLYKTVVKIKKDGEVVDELETYFAFRKIIAENGKVYINDVPTELRLVLNQGYWKDGGMTAPDVECFKKDILDAKQMGFNGMRVHQKVENPWLYYYADTLGMYLWAETPSAYEFAPRTTEALLKTQIKIIKRVYNSPSVIAYVPLNESWGVKEIQHDKRQQALAKSLYHLIKSLDGDRLVVTNDGWENVSDTDLIGIHDYSKYGDAFPAKFGEITEELVPAGRRLMARGEKIGNQPFILSEFGGIALLSDSGWGYNGAENGEEAFFERFERLFQNVSACKFCGWCYTQLTDVEQETNGLLTAEHKPKFDFGKINEIINKYSKKLY